MEVIYQASHHSVEFLCPSTSCRAIRKGDKEVTLDSSNVVRWNTAAAPPFWQYSKLPRGQSDFTCNSPCPNTRHVSHVTHFRKRGVLAKTLKPTFVFLLINKAERYSCASLVTSRLDLVRSFQHSYLSHSTQTLLRLLFFSFKLTRSLAKKNCGHWPR